MSIPKRLSIAFFVSGAAGIVYQMLWIRLLALAFGGVTMVTVLVASIFLAGLAVGAFGGGRIVDAIAKEKSAKTILLGYAAIEMLIIVFGMLNFWAFVQFTLIAGAWRVGIAYTLVFLQACLMGATWPFMFKLFLAFTERWQIAGRITFVNTLGAAFGALFAGTLLIANIGIFGTLVAGIIGNLLAGVFAASLVFQTVSFSERTFRKKNDSGNITRPYPQRTLLFLFILLFLAGFVGMAMEIVWMRVFALLLGGSVYAFSIVVTAILFGLALGGLVVEKWRFTPIHIRGLTWILWLEAFFLFTGLVQLSVMPYILLDLLSWIKITGFLEYQLINSILVAIIVLPVGVLSGMVLPWAIVLFKKSFAVAGKESGRAYLCNTAGSVFGGITAALVLLPILGIYGASVILALPLAFIPLAFFLHEKAFVKAVLTSSIIIGVFWGSFSFWNQQTIGIGAVLYGKQVLAKTSGIETLFYKDGTEATVLVTKRTGMKSLRINGKVDASSELDMGTQAILGHVPIFLHNNPQKVFVIGLGSGVTAGAIAQHRKVKEITTVEIEPAVVEAAEKYFAKENYNVLNDPKMHLVIGDGRNYLLKTEKQFDVITSEPSNPWLLGESNLFTKEFFELGKKRLQSDGVFFQWIQLYNLRPSEVKSIVQTFRTVFPYVQIWTSTNPVDIFLAGKKEPFVIFWERFEEGLLGTRVRESLARRDFADEVRLLSLLWGGNRKAALLSEGGELHTDGKPTLEYKAPFGLYVDTLPDNLSMLLSVYQEDENALPIKGIPKAEKEKLASSRRARKLLVEARKAFAQSQLDIAIKKAEAALHEHKEAPSIKRFLSELYTQKVDTVATQQAITYLTKAIELSPSYSPAYVSLMQAYITKEKKKEAMETIKIAKEKFPWLGTAVMYEGILAGLDGDSKKAETLLIAAKAIEPWNNLIYNNLAHLYYTQNQKDLSLLAWEESLRLNPNQPKIQEMYRLTKRLQNLK